MFLANFLQVFKSTHFLVYFYFKVSLRKETVLNSIKTLKRYSKATLNMFINKFHFLMMTKKNIHMIGFLSQIEILLLIILNC